MILALSFASAIRLSQFRGISYDVATSYGKLKAKQSSLFSTTSEIN